MEEIKGLGVGKRMPNTPPKDDFFEEFTADTLQEISRRERRGRLVRGGVASSLVAAAMVAVVVWISGANDSVDCGGECVAEQFSQGVSLYAAELSDGEIKELLEDTESESMFYSNL